MNPVSTGTDMNLMAQSTMRQTVQLGIPTMGLILPGSNMHRSPHPHSTTFYLPRQVGGLAANGQLRRPHRGGSNALQMQKDLIIQETHLGDVF